MKSAAKIRERAQSTLQAMLELPGTQSFGQGYECMVLAQLGDLAFIDSREAELDQELELLRQRGPWSQLGTWGSLTNVFGSGADVTLQLASIYAQVAARLGYFNPVRRLTDIEWKGAGDVVDWATARPRCMADVKERYGEPSYQGHWPCALGYAGPSDEQWLYFFSTSIEKNPSLDLLFLPPRLRTRRWVDLRLKHDDEVTPEEVYRRFLRAILTGDRSQVLPLIVVHENPACLWEDPYPQEVAAALAATYADVQIDRTLTEAESVVLRSGACPVPLRLVRDGVQWRVDPDPLIRIRTQTLRTEAHEEGAS